MNDDIAPGLKDYIALAIITVISTVSGYFTTRRNSRLTDLETYNKEKEKEEKIAEEKERDVAELKEKERVEHCIKCKEGIFLALKDANQILLSQFQTGTREDQTLRWAIIQELKDNYVKVSDRLEEIALTQADMRATQKAHIDHQKDLCDKVHDQILWTGRDKAWVWDFKHGSNQGSAWKTTNLVC